MNAEALSAIQARAARMVGLEIKVGRTDADVAFITTPEEGVAALIAQDRFDPAGSIIAKMGLNVVAVDADQSAAVPTLSLSLEG